MDTKCIKIYFSFDHINLINDTIKCLNLGDSRKGTNRNCYRAINLTQNGPCGRSKFQIPAKVQIPKDIWIIDFCYSFTEINLGMCLAHTRIALEVEDNR